MGVGEQKEEGANDLLGKEEFLGIVGRREDNVRRKEECFEKKVDQEIQKKNDFDKISADKMENRSENVWEESEREDLGRILLASRDIHPWEQVSSQSEKNYCGSYKVFRWSRMRRLCWLQQTGWFALPAFTPCLTNLTPALPVPGLCVALPVLPPPQQLPTIDLSAGC